MVEQADSSTAPVAECKQFLPEQQLLPGFPAETSDLPRPPLVDITPALSDPNHGDHSAEAIAALYAQLRSTRRVADAVGCSRQWVWETLRSLGIVFSCRGQRVPRVAVNCGFCGKPGEKLLSQFHGRRWFCCRQHFLDEIKNPDYRPWRQGQRIARKAVSKYFQLEKRHVVHHHDENNHNNAISNLAVFASQSDHLSYHRGGPVEPIWDGRKVNMQETSLPPIHAQEEPCATK